MNKKDKTQLIVIGVLLLGLPFLLLNANQAFKKAKELEDKRSRALGITKNEAGNVRAKQEPAINTLVQNAGVSYKMLEEQTDNISVKRDPFDFSSEPASSDAVYRLKGVLMDKDQTKAIINDLIVCCGSKIGDVVVVEIKQESVILNDGSRDFEIKLRQ